MKKRSSPKTSRRKGARLGQHFLTGTWAAAKLAACIEVAPGETILEIGPGKGALTRELLKYGPVVAIEKDGALQETLEQTLGDDLAHGTLRLIFEDIRNFSPEKIELTNYVVAANIPYYITGEIIRQFLTARIQPRAMALLVQKEVAERIIARDAKESLLSLSVKVYGTPKVVAKVSKGNFSPPPSVDSSIILIGNISRARFANVDENVFFETLRAGFASKRKYLSGNLAKHFGKDVALRALTECGVPEKARAEDVALEAWLHIAKALQRIR